MRIMILAPSFEHVPALHVPAMLFKNLQSNSNTNRLLNEGAPRSTDVQAEIDAVISSTEALVKALMRMNDYTRKAFERNPDMPCYLGQYDGEPDPPAYSSYSDLDCELIRNLLSVRDAGAAVPAKYRKRSSSLDRGGNTNLLRKSTARLIRIWSRTVGWYSKRFNREKLQGPRQTAHLTSFRVTCLDMRPARIQKSTPGSPSGSKPWLYCSLD